MKKINWTLSDYKAVSFMTLGNGLWFGFLLWIILGAWFDLISFTTCWFAATVFSWIVAISRQTRIIEMRDTDGDDWESEIIAATITQGAFNKIPGTSEALNNEPEIKLILDALNGIKNEFSNYFYFETISEYTVKRILANKLQIVTIMKRENISPRRIAYSWLNNVAGDLLESGDYHVHRGVLTPIGEEYLRIFDKTTDYLIAEKAFDSKYAQQHKQNIRERVKLVG